MWTWIIFDHAGPNLRIWRQGENRGQRFKDRLPWRKREPNKNNKNSHRQRFEKRGLLEFCLIATDAKTEKTGEECQILKIREDAHLCTYPSNEENFEI